MQVALPWHLEKGRNCPRNLVTLTAKDYENILYQSRYLLKAFPVSFIKCIQIPAVYIQDRDYVSGHYLRN